MGDGPHSRTQRDLCEENQNRQTRLRDLRRRMATSSRTLPQRHNAGKIRNPDATAFVTEVDCFLMTGLTESNRFCDTEGPREHRPRITVVNHTTNPERRAIQISATA